ncbi:hypothetical protein [Niastella populi]|uniref:Uncharacterized protein n=1 Tax=Niastella populi TaxID=550983 RepID=A0A1V9F590_9BACT|nr:hypothetical protein [Niastella populi]OQP53548.1 hypothetical protein A4R26_06100 [Niastella populi]
MELLVKILLSLCSFLPGVHAHTSQQHVHGFSKHFYTLPAGDLNNLQNVQAVVSQRRSAGDRRANDEAAEREEESEDDDDDESRSSKKHPGSGSNFITYNSASNNSAHYFLNQFSANGQLSHFSANKFIIHCVFRI